MFKYRPLILQPKTISARIVGAVAFALSGFFFWLALHYLGLWWTLGLSLPLLCSGHLVISVLLVIIGSLLNLIGLNKYPWHTRPMTSTEPGDDLMWKFRKGQTKKLAQIPGSLETIVKNQDGEMWGVAREAREIKHGSPICNFSKCSLRTIPPAKVCSSHWYVAIATAYENRRRALPDSPSEPTNLDLIYVIDVLKAKLTGSDYKPPANPSITDLGLCSIIGCYQPSYGGYTEICYNHANVLSFVIIDARITEYPWTSSAPCPMDLFILESYTALGPLLGMRYRESEELWEVSKAIFRELSADIAAGFTIGLPSGHEQAYFAEVVYNNIMTPEGPITIYKP